MDVWLAGCEIKQNCKEADEGKQEPGWVGLERHVHGSILYLLVFWLKGVTIRHLSTIHAPEANSVTDKKPLTFRSPEVTKVNRLLCDLLEMCQLHRQGQPQHRGLHSCVDAQGSSHPFHLRIHHGVSRPLQVGT